MANNYFYHFFLRRRDRTIFADQRLAGVFPPDQFSPDCFDIYALFFGQRTALVALLISGFWLDLFSFDFFGLYLTALFLLIILAQRILTGWLTNCSLYSFLLLILISTVVYNLISGFLLYFSAYQTESFFLIRSDFWLIVAYQSIWSLVAALLAFSLTAAVTRHLKPFFLEKKSLV